MYLEKGRDSLDIMLKVNSALFSKVEFKSISE